jgi:hypothetical protein
MAFLSIFVFVFVIVLLIWLSFKNRTPVPIISNPVLGVLNLMGPSAADIIKEDLESLTQYFSEVRQADDGPPVCDVLLLYCEIDSSGIVNGSSQSLREIIGAARAPVAVVATNNEGENYIAALAGTTAGRANLVQTIDRRGPLFASFLAQLFEQMSRGVSMPVAWANLAPQYPGAEHQDLPETICALEAGQIAFG